MSFENEGDSDVSSYNCNNEEKHSSPLCIVLDLRKNNLHTQHSIKREIILYSVLAIGGIALFGLTGFMFINSNAMVGYLFLGLAVLTAPHMQIMYNMYNSIRLIKPAEN